MPVKQPANQRASQWTTSQIASLMERLIGHSMLFNSTLLNRLESTNDLKQETKNKCLVGCYDEYYDAGKVDDNIVVLFVSVGMVRARSGRAGGRGAVHTTKHLLLDTYTTIPT